MFDSQDIFNPVYPICVHTSDRLVYGVPLHRNPELFRVCSTLTQHSMPRCTHTSNQMTVIHYVGRRFANFSTSLDLWANRRSPMFSEI